MQVTFHFIQNLLYSKILREKENLAVKTTFT